MNLFKLTLLLSVLQLLTLISTAQKIELLDSGRATSIRGLSVVNNNVVWVSGSNGTVGKSTDGGKSWSWMIVHGFEKKEFRDIEAFDSQTAIILAVDEPGLILKTHDGGQNWKTVFIDSTKGMFLDAMDFNGNKNGIVVGDPIDNKIYFAVTTNGGESWSRSQQLSITNQAGEAFFASSGTNIRYLNKGDFVLVSGGTKSRLITKSTTTPLSIIQGKESTGANSVAIFKKRIVIVGGDFANAKDTIQNCLISNNGGVSFSAPATPPGGYRSCVEFLTASKLVTCGITGVDLSSDGGITWNSLSSLGFHVCRKAKKGNTVYLAGGRGRIAKLVW